MASLLVFSACKKDDASPLNTADEQVVKERRRGGGSIPASITLNTDPADASQELQAFYNYVIQTQDQTAYGTRNSAESVWVLEAFANYNFGNQDQVLIAAPVDTASVVVNTQRSGVAGPAELSTAWEEIVETIGSVYNSLSQYQVVRAIDIVFTSEITEGETVIGWNFDVITIAGLMANPVGEPEYIAEVSSLSICDAYPGEQLYYGKNSGLNVDPLDPAWLTEQEDFPIGSDNFHYLMDRRITATLYNSSCTNETCEGIYTNISIASTLDGLYDQGLLNGSTIDLYGDGVNTHTSPLMLNQTEIDYFIDEAHEVLDYYGTDWTAVSSQVPGGKPIPFNFIEGHIDSDWGFPTGPFHLMYHRYGLCSNYEVDIPKMPIE